jgi:hypothetical protein
MKIEILIPVNVKSKLSVINALKKCVSNPKEVTTQILKEKLPLNINTTLNEIHPVELEQQLNILEENGAKSEVTFDIKEVTLEEKKAALKLVFDDFENYYLKKEDWLDHPYSLYTKNGSFILYEDSRIFNYIIEHLLKTNIPIK